MHIIIDSGSTSTEVAIINGVETACIPMSGLNPLFCSTDFIKNEIKKKVFPKIETNKVTQVYFYGAGCHGQTERQKIKDVFSSLFENTNVEVNTDLLGAARAIFNNLPGVACIFGTGMNCGLYNGNVIAENNRPLGYVLGDEFSGAWFGKKLVEDFFKNDMHPSMRTAFEKKFHPNKDKIIQKLYAGPFPNQFLASYFPFIAENQGNPYVDGISEWGFNLFFEYYARPYFKKGLLFGFVGSVAFELEGKIWQYAKGLGFGIEKIIKSPIEGLIKFHSRK